MGCFSPQAPDLAVSWALAQEEALAAVHLAESFDHETIRIEALQLKVLGPGLRIEARGPIPFCLELKPVLLHDAW